MKFIITLVSAIISLFAAGSYAETVFRTPAGASTHHFVHYKQGERHFVDQFTTDKTGFTERTASHSFVNVVEAQAKLNDLTSRYKASPHVVSYKNVQAKVQGPVFSLWQVTQEWSEEWEDRYSQWMKENFTPTFFSENNLVSDCADVPVTMRWIFARIHGLPAGNHLVTGELFTQDSAPERWTRLSTHADWRLDQRFLRAIDYVQSMTYTGSVFYDLYPVAINNRTITPGAIFLTKGEHTQNVGRVDFASEHWLEFYSSTVPRVVRGLYQDPFQMWDSPTPDMDGFQRPRWIKLGPDQTWQMVGASEMPWYSLEQYTPEFRGSNAIGFAAAMYLRLSGNSLDPVVQLRTNIFGLNESILLRQEIVENGYKACFPDLCPEGSQGWEDWSTPSRDRHILEKILAIQDLILANPDNPTLAQIWEEHLEMTFFYISSDDEEYWAELYMSELVDIWLNARYSFDPHHSIRQRWGLSP